MSNTIPPLLSNSPPPPPSPDDEEDDEFGNFTISNDFSFTCDGFISSPSPSESPKIEKVESRTNIIEEIENDEIKASEDIVIQQEVLSIFSSGLQPDEKYYSKTSFTKVSDNNDISSQFDELCLNNSDKEEQKYNVMRNILDDKSGLNSYEEGDRDPVLIDSFIKNDVIRAVIKNDTLQDEKEIGSSNDDMTQKSMKLADENGTECVIETNGLNNPLRNPDIFNDNKKSNGESMDFLAKEIFRIDDECIKSGDTYSIRGNSKSTTVDEVVQQENSVVCASTENNTSEQRSEDYILDGDISSHESSFDDSSSTSQDKQNASDEIIPPKPDIESHTISHNGFGPTETTLESDGFGDFTAFSPKKEDKVDLEVLKKKPLEVPTPATLDYQECKGSEKFADCLDFESKHISSEDSDDEFADFASFEATNIPKTIQVDGSTLFSSAPLESRPHLHQPSTSLKANDLEKTMSEPIFISLNDKEAFEKSKQIIQEMYPTFQEVLKDCDFDDLEDDVIFKQLKDVTDTPALSYHWSKSTTQKFLLKALNIDVRNMMFGPTWNPTIPRFAAHVGLQPLEPVKADHTTSTSVILTPSIPQTRLPDSPSAQFDWTSSGLDNPLDFAVDAKGIPTQQQAETSSVSAPEIPITTKDIEFANDNDFREFESYQPPAVSIDWPNSLPLRETHISNVTSELSVQSNIEAWLQPTILTPELTRRKLGPDESTSTIVTPEVVKEDISVQGSDDEFDDFQMVLPEKDNTHTTISIVPNLDVKNVPEKSGSQTMVEPEPVIPTPSNADAQSSSNSLGVASQDEDDEFTDFHFSMPKVGHAANSILMPSSTPLEPTPVHPKTERTHINWPDPGLTDDELRKFETVFSGSLNFNQEANAASKSAVVEEDEWSEFVSVQKPSPVHKLKSGERERTSSPDLTLSVFNLGSIQPTKPPVPVITPQGLVQTKLSSNTSTSSPKMQPKGSRSAYAGQQPSIISNQFASQAYNFGSYNYDNVRPAGASQIRDKMVVNAPREEDEWGEFVSSPLPPKLAQNAWAGQTPNIIMNPGHYVQSASDIGKRVGNRNSTVANSLMPELDFIAPKTRTTVSRKK